MRVGNHTLHTLIIGLSDHGGQLLQLRNIDILTRLNKTKKIHNFSKHNIQNFKTYLSYEIWDTIYTFNNFHNSFLRIFSLKFP
jgi:hypothetical protein